VTDLGGNKRHNMRDRDDLAAEQVCECFVCVQRKCLCWKLSTFVLIKKKREVKKTCQIIFLNSISNERLETRDTRVLTRS